MIQPQAAELAQSLFEALGRYAKAVMLHLPTEAPGAGGVTKEQWGALVEAGHAGAEGIAMGELAARRGMAVNSATAVVERLVHAGLVERVADPSDRRVVRVRLTAAGTRLRDAVGALRRAQYVRLLEQLTPDERERLAAAIPALARLAEAAGRTR